ncbi:hypothetical protein HY413_00675 [Candidatus Kaiserbacteria bacterium]|nr:hypothetical protein [Candidatus Kaiserbacteria bacterium]
MTHYVYVPPGVTDWYAGGVAVDVVRARFTALLDRNKGANAWPKPFGGSRLGQDAQDADLTEDLWLERVLRETGVSKDDPTSHRQWLKTAAKELGLNVTQPEVDPEMTARREGLEEIHFLLQGPAELVSFVDRGSYGEFLYRFDLSSQEFDEQVARAESFGLNYGRHILHVVNDIEAVLNGTQSFVPHYREVLGPTFRRILAEHDTYWTRVQAGD